MSVPEGYAKKRKRDEYSPPRPPRGMPKLCKCCYSGSPVNIDNICVGCLKDWNRMAKLCEVIYQAHPQLRKLSMPAVFEKVWKKLQLLQRKK